MRYLIDHPEIICLLVCAVHSVVSVIVGIVQKRKIDRFCDKCGSPVFEGDIHDCKFNLSIEQIVELMAIARRGDEDGDK